jgi:prepilin signal peptidase PulO-like enzyme (type II secretory pathway)
MELMLVVFVLTGLLVGWLLNIASDYLPRFAATPPQLPDAVRALAIIAILDRRHTNSIWLRLHLAVELLTAAFFLWLGARGDSAVNIVVLAATFSVFMLIAIIDLKYRLVLNVVTYPAMIATIAVQSFVLHHDLRSVIVGGGLAFGVFFLVATLKPGQLGGGDVKLAALIGLTFGFPGVLWALLVGAGAGGVMALILLSRRAGMKYRIAYAPYLCFGAIAILMYYSLQTAL